MITDITFDDFWKAHVSAARKIAKNQLAGFKKKLTSWDGRIDEDDICEETVINAMQIVYDKFDPSKGNLFGMFKTVIHNEMHDIIKAEADRLYKNSDLDLDKDWAHTWGSVTSKISDSDMSRLEDKLRYAIGKLGPMDQTILWIYLDDPKTYIQRAVDELGIKSNNVSVRKNRAIEKLQALMDMTKTDYYDMFEERPMSGFLSCLTLTTAEPKQTNFVYPEFNLEIAANRIANIIRTFKGEI